MKNLELGDSIVWKHGGPVHEVTSIESRGVKLRGLTGLFVWEDLKNWNLKEEVDD